jgi:hypothetical protein
MCKFVVGLASLVAALAIAPAAGASVIMQDVPVSATIDACGETISYSGTYSYVLVEQVLPNGGLAVQYLFTNHDVYGTSTSGASYHLTGVTRGGFVDSPGGASTVTIVSRFHLGSTMGGTTFYATVTTHFTRNANGDVVVDFQTTTISCI